MVIGAPKHGDDDRGRVYLYNGSGGAWTESATFEGEPDKLLGNIVAVDGDTAVAAEAKNLVSEEPFYFQDTPRVHIFERAGVTWQIWGQLNGIHPPVFALGPKSFGSSLAIEGDMLVIGAPETRSYVSTLEPKLLILSESEVLLYRRDETGWTYTQTLTLPRPRPMT